MIFKKAYTKPLPQSAEISVKRDGTRIARWTDRRGKKYTTRLSDDGTRIIGETETWYCRYRRADGTVCEVSTGCKDKGNAEAFLRERESVEERIAAGILSPTEANTREHARSAIDKHVTAYGADMDARGLSVGHKKAALAFVKEINAACGIRALRDISRDRVEAYLADRVEKGMSVRSHNHRGVVFTAFCAWCVKTGRLSRNPMTGSRRLNEAANPKRPRRALAVEECAALIDAARRRPLEECLRIRHGERTGELAANMSDRTRVHLEMLGVERAAMYQTLLETGLRWSELKSVTLAQVDFNAPANISIAAADEKARRGAQIPLRQTTVAALSEYLAHRLKIAQRAAQEAGQAVPLRLDAGLKLFPDMAARGTRAFDKDLKYAGVKKLTPSGTADVHSLRTTFGTLLARSGAPLQILQRAMRHSDPALTMRRYVHLTLLDIGAAVENLPDLKKADSQLALQLALSGGASVQSGAFSGNTDENREIAIPISEGDKKAQETLVNQGILRKSGGGNVWQPVGDSNPCDKTENLAS